MRSELTKAIALRNERKFQESNEMLTELALKYPDDPEISYHCAWSFDVLVPANKAIQAFYSMTLFNTGQHDKAMELLLKSLVETSSDKNIQSYKKAILFYSDKLEKTWT